MKKSKQMNCDNKPVDLIWGCPKCSRIHSVDWCPKVGMITHVSVLWRKQPASGH